MNFEYQTTEERHEIVSDLPRFSKEVRIVGTATRYNSEDHLVVRLRLLPVIRYFLKEKDCDADEFVLYSGMSRESDSVRFYNPVGTGEKISDEFIKIKLHDLNLIFYLRLKPRDECLKSPAA